MKLASHKSGRDGRLLVVSRDLSRAVDATVVAPSLQAALDNWSITAPLLTEMADTLEAGRGGHVPFDPASCAAPLPRAFQWVDGSAYMNHVELLRRARGAAMPGAAMTDPLMYQGGSDALLGPKDPIMVADTAFGIDFEAEVAVIVDDVPMEADPATAAEAIRLIVLVNDVSLRHLIPPELAKGFGFLQSKPPTAFSPIAVTPDELGEAFDGMKISLPLISYLNGAMFGRPNAGVDMTFDFGSLIAHAAKTRPLSAGTIVGSGTVSNRDADGGPGRPVAEGGAGFSCIAEQRSVEIIRSGQAITPFLQFGDHVHIEMFGLDGQSIFGAIDQVVQRYDRSTRPPGSRNRGLQA